MADENKSNSTPLLAFAIGGLVVAVGILAYFMFGGDAPTTGGGGDTNISVETSDTGSGSGEASGDSEPAAESGGGSGNESSGETSN